MGPLAEIQRPSSFHPTALFLDGHRRPRLYRTCILSQSISLFKYPSELSAKPHSGEASGHFDPQIVRTNQRFMPKLANSVLVIDDEPQIRRFVSVGLELHGYTVKEANTGAAGLSAAAHVHPDVIVLD